MNDDEDSLFLLRLSIAKASPEAEVIEERSAKSALALHRRAPADLIITDNSMPLMSGLEMIAIIRATDAHTPIVMMSGADHIGPQAKAAGATMFLSTRDHSQLPAMLAALLPAA